MYTNMYICKHASLSLSLFLCLPSFFHTLHLFLRLLRPSFSFFLSSWTEKQYKYRERKNTYTLYGVEPAFNCSSTCICIFSIQLKYRENYQANGIECVENKINSIGHAQQIRANISFIFKLIYIFRYFCSESVSVSLQHSHSKCSKSKMSFRQF